MPPFFGIRVAGYGWHLSTKALQQAMQCFQETYVWPGFFVTRQGHLLTAYHAVKDFVYPAEPDGEGWAYLGLAELRRMQGELDESRFHFESALRLFRETNSQTEIAGAVGSAELARCRGAADLGAVRGGRGDVRTPAS